MSRLTATLLCLVMLAIVASNQPAGFCARATLALPAYAVGVITESQFESFALHAWIIETPARLGGIN